MHWPSIGDKCCNSKPWTTAEGAVKDRMRWAVLTSQEMEMMKSSQDFSLNGASADRRPPPHLCPGRRHRHICRLFRRDVNPNVFFGLTGKVEVIRETSKLGVNLIAFQTFEKASHSGSSYLRNRDDTKNPRRTSATSFSIAVVSGRPPRMASSSVWKSDNWPWKWTFISCDGSNGR